MRHPRGSGTTRLAGLAVACLSGGAYFVSFPGIGIWPLALVSWVPMIVLVHGQPVTWALAFGSGYGLVFVGAGFAWLPSALQAFGNLAPGGALALASAVIIYQAFYFGLWAGLQRILEMTGVPPAPSAVAAFIVVETMFPLIVPLHLAATMTPVPLWMQSADVLGVTGIGVTIVCVNAFVAHFFLEWTKGSRSRWVMPLLAIVPMADLLYGSVRIGQIGEAIDTAPELRVALIQPNVHPAEARLHPEQGLREHVIATMGVLKHHPSLILWGETTTGYTVARTTASAWFGDAFARHVGTPLLFGSALSEGPPGQRRVFNAAVLTDEHGEVEGTYMKRRLLPLVERSIFGVHATGTPFTAGDETQPPLVFGRHCIAVSICYEDLLPATVRKTFAAHRANLLVNVSDDAWLGQARALNAHFALAIPRAIENRVFAVRVNNSGVSGVVDPAGRVITRTEPFARTVVMSNIKWMNESTIYQVVGDTVWWVISFATLMWIAVYLGAAKLRCSQR